MKTPLLSKPPFDFRPGTAPLLVSMPHVGTELPECLQGRLSDACAPLGDTDWHLPRLYDFVEGMGASVLAARYTRFAVDLNRPPDDTPLYTTATTGLHPDIIFDGAPAFREGARLTPDECQGFLEEIWHPYHQRIAEELDRIKARHGYALLFDAHSIRGEVPRLFEGQLPEFNLGTDDGRSADVRLTERLAQALSDAPGRVAVNGRFKGGYITRRYGRPKHDIHAVQLELVQRTYMSEKPPYQYLPEAAAQVRPWLERFVATMIGWGRERYA
jgi:N-formylglutamate deformylase